MYWLMFDGRVILLKKNDSAIIECSLQTNQQHPVKIPLNSAPLAA